MADNKPHLIKDPRLKLYRVKYGNTSSTFSAKVNSYYLTKIASLKKELHISNNADLLTTLIDCYCLEESESVRRVRRTLLERVKRGVDGHFFIQLRLLYTALGHLLKKAGAI